MKYTIYTDGLTEPNPGKSAWAFIVYDNDGNEVAQQSEFMGNNFTNNAAEYRAVIEALVWCHEKDTDEFLILSDSRLVVNQLNGEWQVKSNSIRSWYDNANDLIEPHVQIAWVKGTENKADELTRLAYEKETGLYPMPRTNGERYARLVKR